MRNQCCGYCQTCRTYVRFCRQLYFKDGDMTEDDLEDIAGLGFIIRWSNIPLYFLTDELKRDETI